MAVADQHPQAEDLISSNQHLDLDQIREAQKLVGMLHTTGIVTRPTYGIASPYERHCAAPTIR